MTEILILFSQQLLGHMIKLSKDTEDLSTIKQVDLINVVEHHDKQQWSIFF